MTAQGRGQEARLHLQNTSRVESLFLREHPIDHWDARLFPLAGIL